MLIKKVINKGTPVVYVISMKIHETRTCALYSNPEVGEVRDVRKNKLVDLINKEDVLWNNTAACSLLSLDIFSFHWQMAKWCHQSTQAWYAHLTRVRCLCNMPYCCGGKNLLMLSQQRLLSAASCHLLLIISTHLYPSFPLCNLIKIVHQCFVSHAEFQHLVLQIEQLLLQTCLLTPHSHKDLAQSRVNLKAIPPTSLFIIRPSAAATSIYNSRPRFLIYSCTWRSNSNGRPSFLYGNS